MVDRFISFRKLRGIGVFTVGESAAGELVSSPESVAGLLNGCRGAILDIVDEQCFGSDTLGMLIKIHKAVTGAKLRSVFCITDQSVMEAFGLLKLNPLGLVFTTIGDALDSFGETE